MFGRLFLPAILTLTLQGQGTGPSYSSTGLVNGATYLPGPLAPNTWTTLYGTNLSFNTCTANPAASDGQWPTDIPGCGVQVVFGGGTLAHLSYVSPTEIDFLTPASHSPGNTTVTVVRNSLRGPMLTATFVDASPGLYQDNGLAIAHRGADGATLDNNNPAHPGDAVVLYGTGLGQTAVPLDTQSDGRLVTSTDSSALRIARFAEFSVTLDGVAIDPSLISWAGLLTGFAGTYQINFQLPDNVEPNPVIRVWIADQGSADGIHLAVQPLPPPDPGPPAGPVDSPQP